VQGPAAAVKGEPVDLACRRCALCNGRTKVVAGRGPRKARLVLVGEGPGAKEDESGAPFVGRAGALLDRALGQAGLLREQVFITNVVKCRPPQNRKPKPEERLACRPFLVGEIEAAGAPVLVALGATAAQALVGRPVAVDGSGSAPIRVDFEGSPRAVYVTLHPSSARFRKGAVEKIAAALARAADEARLPRRPQARLPAQA